MNANGGNNIQDRECSICMETILNDRTRGKAELMCGHFFHLDCIGSYFNFQEGEMKCPNCRLAEEGDWKKPVFERILIIDDNGEEELQDEGSPVNVPNEEAVDGYMPHNPGHFESEDEEEYNIEEEAPPNQVYDGLYVTEEDAMIYPRSTYRTTLTSVAQYHHSSMTGSLGAMHGNSQQAPASAFERPLLPLFPTSSFGSERPAFERRLLPLFPTSSFGSERSSANYQHRTISNFTRTMEGVTYEASSSNQSESLASASYQRGRTISDFTSTRPPDNFPAASMERARYDDNEPLVYSLALP